MLTPYRATLHFDKKHFTVFIKINQLSDTIGDYHYDLEIRTDEKISGNEFQRLKKYLEVEGYIDQAINCCKKNS